MPSNIEAKITQTARDNQFTIIGDGNHADLGIRDFVYGRNTMEALRDGGVKHVFIEIPQSLQHNADGLASGETTREQFVGAMSSSMNVNYGDNATAVSYSERIADQILFAKQNGMRVHFADPENEKHNGTNFGAGPNLERVALEVERQTLRENGIEPTGDNARDELALVSDKTLHAKFFENFDRHVAALPPEERAQVEREQEEFRQSEKQYDESRFNDEDLYNYITEVAGDQKSAVIYGAGHDDLASRLDAGGYKNSGIEVYASEQQRVAADRLEAERSGRQNPYDHAAYLDTDTIESGSDKTQSAAPAAAPATRQPVPAL